MNSPVSRLLSHYIRIDKTDVTAIYLQIAQGIINAIHTKALLPTTKLPGTRTICDMLYVHRKTVIAAYEELAAQGWIEIIPQKGAFVTAKKIKNVVSNISLSSETPSKSSFSIEKNIALVSPYSNIRTAHYFTEGTPDYRLASLKTINQIFSSLSIKKSTSHKLNRPHIEQNDNIKHQLINYLHITQGININTQQLMIANTSQIAIQTIIQTVLKPKDKVLVFDSGNFEVNMLFKHYGVEIITIRNVQDDLKEVLENDKIKAIYIQSNQLYPKTQALEDNQKYKLLELAQEHAVAIIEDDNNNTFDYNKNLSSSLKKIDKNGTVIYFNSFQDILPAPYNLAYIVAPNNVIDELNQVYKSLSNTTNYLIEETLAEYIKEGFLMSQIQKNKKVYLKRRNHFQQLLVDNLEQIIDFDLPPSGLAFWITFHQKLPLLSIAKYSENLALTIPSYLLYQNKQLTGIRLGFAHMNEQEAEDAIAIWSKAIYQHIYK